MSVLSKDLARQIAVKLTEKSRIVAENLHVEYRELATSMYEDQTPDEIKAALKKYPDWFDSKCSMRVDEHGFNWEYITGVRRIACNSNSECLLKLTTKTAEKLLKAKRKWQKAKENYEKLKDETKNALLALKTYNNIRKELPEAAPFLPPPMSNALVVSFDSLKRKLNNQTDISQKVVTIEDGEE